MEQKKIDRINELYKKSKAEGLTPEEAKEQKILRKEYMELIRVNLRSQLNKKMEVLLILVRSMAKNI